jgi:hypothetical protein
MIRRIPRPSPAMVVALIAVVLAIVGTATAALKGKDKKKVRSIADQEIARLAPGLSVASAQTAQNATSLGGVGANGFPQVFSGAADATTSNNAPIFSVPALGVTILSKASGATGADFKVRNDNATAAVVIGTTADSTQGTPVAAGNTSAAVNGTASPVLITVNGKPDSVLQVTCAIGASAGKDLVCIGLLKG